MIVPSRGGLDRHWCILLLILTRSLFSTMIDKLGSRSNGVEATLSSELEVIATLHHRVLVTLPYLMP